MNNADKLSVAGYTISVYEPDRFRLDGGAMFGSVPKTLWSKKIAADEANRIQLTCRLMILRGHGRIVIVDLGMGRKWSDKERQIYAIEALDEQPIWERCSDVTDVVLTHLHFDHCGGIARWTESGESVPAFPRAATYVQRANLEAAKKPGVRERASYLANNVQPVEALNDRLHLCESDQEILPGITVHAVNGHTEGLQWIKVGEGRGAVVYPADLIPTAHHLGVPYVMGYDLCAKTSMEEKAKFLEQAIAEEWIVVFEHDAHTPAAILGRDERGNPIVKQVVTPPTLNTPGD